ncbi:hypothetical protein BGX26_000005 [Mortierella sp. AD094]|nr:hypothetical protein BGX26_000005 [Mortierella sp. AD094]
MGRYMESLAVIDGQIWMVYATRCMGHGFKHLTAKFYLHILITILRKSAHRIAFMVFLPGYICPVMPFASRMRSLTRVQFAGSYNSQEMSHIIQFLRLRQGHGKIPGAGGLGLRECNLPLLTLSDSVDKTHHHQHHHHHHHHHQHKQLNTMQLSQRGQIQQLQLIHSLGRPLSLDASSYWDFFSISHVVSRHTLSRLEKFKHVHGFLGAAGGNFLRRCRALQELEFGSFDKNSFSWAEDEKTQRIQDTFGTEIIEGSEDFASPLVQLREARLTVSEWLVGHILKSVAYGFTHSLENLLFNVCDHDQLLHVLCASKVSQIERDAAPDKTFCIDYSFRLPKLKKLRLVRLTNKIAIGQGAFQGCPELESLFISGPVTRVQDKQEFFDVFHNPKLKLLELGHGGASVHFNFQSLEYSPLLESLALREYLPEELENLEPPMLDPVPWTWKLEQLTVIQMSGRPAFHFRFEWIRCCRSLQTLVVDGVTHTALQPNKEDIKKGKCGAQLRTCDLQVYTMQDFDKSNLAQLIETYCAHVNQLKLNGGRKTGFTGKIGGTSKPGPDSQFTSIKAWASERQDPSANEQCGLVSVLKTKSV